MATHQEVEDQRYQRIAEWVRGRDTITGLQLLNQWQMSYGGSLSMLDRLRREGLIGEPDADGYYQVLV